MKHVTFKRRFHGYIQNSVTFSCIVKNRLHCKLMILLCLKYNEFLCTSKSALKHAEYKIWSEKQLSHIYEFPSKEFRLIISPGKICLQFNITRFQYIKHKEIDTQYCNTIKCIMQIVLCEIYTNTHRTNWLLFSILNN